MKVERDINIGSRKKRVVFFLLPIYIYIYIYIIFGTILDYFGDKTLGGHYGIAYY